MLESILHYLRGRSHLELGRDLLDVVIVYYVCYRALLVLRGTRALQVGVGLGAVFVFYIAASLLKLVTVLSILSTFISSMLLVIVVVFQADIRRALMRLGGRAWLGRARALETQIIDEVVQAATELARHRVGAIITLEQDANLDEFVGVNRGVDVDAAVSSELLVSLFVPEGMNKLHDGAVIIRNYRLAKAGVFFPMPDQRTVDQSFGSRHRAALGITEETDAVVVVVSEERGTISFCFDGNIASNLDGPKLRTMLEAIFAPKVRKKAAKRPAPSDPEREVDRPRVTEAPVRISIAEEAPPPSRRARVDSDAPPPLRPRPVSDAEATGRNKPVPLRASASADPLAEDGEGGGPDSDRGRST